MPSFQRPSWLPIVFVTLGLGLGCSDIKLDGNPVADGSEQEPPPAMFQTPTILSVSGTMAPGETVTLTGGGFGAKATPSPIRYDGFETGTTVGHLIADDIPWWSRQKVNTQVATIADDNCQTHKGKCGKFVVSTSNTNTALRSDSIFRESVGFNATGKAYLNFYQYVDVLGTADGSASSYQIKFVDMYRKRNSDGSLVLPEFQFSHWVYGSPPNIGWYNKTTWTEYRDIPPAVPFHTPRDTFKTAAWYNIAVELDFGDIGVANGIMKVRVSTPGFVGAYSTSTQVNTMFIGGPPPPGAPIYPDYLRIGWYHGSYYPTNPTTFTSTLYYDDIYIDNSWARIEIGNAASYDDCTHREIQVPSAWSDNSVTFTANSGSFSPGQTVFVFAINEAGEASQGFGPLTVE